MTDIRAALEALDLHCENFTGNDHRPAYDQCLRFGRTPDAHYGAERTCWPCTIRAALAAASPEPERTTIWYVPDCGYTHLSDDGTIYAVCPDGVKPHAPAAPTVEALTVGIMTAEEYQEAFGEPAAPSVEALRDALLARLYPGKYLGMFPVQVAEARERMTADLDAIIAAARADERTRLSGVTHFEQDGCEGHP